MRFPVLPRAALAAAFAVAALFNSTHLVAHGTDLLERAPQAPAPNAPVEELRGELRELVVNDLTAKASIRYRWVVAADGAGVIVRGDGVDPTSSPAW